MNAEGGWADLELVQRIARAETLSGAARALGVDQTTASRRLAALERRLGATLFDRVGGRLAPTPA
ncbi:MAG: LysR family transcriptional regulator, partial [Roseiarcus sp.]